MNANELAEQLDEYAGNSGYSHNDYADSMSQAATMLRTIPALQAEIEALKKHNEELQKACIESLVWVMGNGVYCSLDIEVILKNVLGIEWKDYK